MRQHVTAEMLRNPYRRVSHLAFSLNTESTTCHQRAGGDTNHVSGIVIVILNLIYNAKSVVTTHEAMNLTKATAARNARMSFVDSM